MSKVLDNPNRRALLATATLGAAGLALVGRTASAQMTAAPPTVATATSKRVVMVISNQVDSPAAGFPVGYWLAELAHPYWAFTQKGYTVDIVSPLGGPVVYDAMSDPEGGRFGNANDFLSIGFKRSGKVTPLLASTGMLAAVKPEDYDAIFVVGGLGPMVTFADNRVLHQLAAAFHDRGKVVATLCHGSVILLKSTLSNGKLLVDGKQWTGFCNLEEDAVDKAYNTKVQPFRIESEAARIPNTRFVQGPAYRPFAVRDGQLVSGQQGSSGARTAELVIAALEEAGRSG